VIKRFLDLLVSSLSLIFLVPFFLLFGVLIKIDSKGPVFFIQKRVGKQGKLFELFKFRTMTVDSESRGFLTVGVRDARITRFGSFLRRFKIDELPQLINVFLGQMSLVGPRPEVKKFVDHYNEDEIKVLSTRPGITDPASLKFRNENSLLEGQSDPSEYYIKHIMPEKLSLNLAYMEKQNFFSDLGIIFKTIFLIFRGKSE
jgi:lipopolysaccharide/colanic/teichoic acid biosynthesis glycosyltransferase